MKLQQHKGIMLSKMIIWGKILYQDFWAKVAEDKCYSKFMP